MASVWRGVNTTTTTSAAPHQNSSVTGNSNSDSRNEQQHRSNITESDELSPPPPLPPPPQNFSSGGETVEAVLNRLLKSYTMAMECINTIQKFDTTLVRAAECSGGGGSSTSNSGGGSDFTTSSNEPNDTRTLPQTTTTTTTTHPKNNNNKTDTDAAIHQLIRLVWAARTTLEASIFCHPLLLQQSQSLHTIATCCSLSYNHHTVPTNTDPSLLSVTSVTSIPQLLTSPSHISTVRQITYLSLINYADLLLMGLSPSKVITTIHSNTSNTTNNITTTTILDRGVIESLHIVRNNSNRRGPISSLSSCWVSTNRSSKSSDLTSNTNTATVDTTTDNNNNDDDDYTNCESEEDTVRLAIMAYMDAVSIDASDPTVYIKLACATRRLNRIFLLSWPQQRSSTDTTMENDVTPPATTPPPTTTELSSSSSSSSIVYGKYRTLERYALESAILAVVAPRNHGTVPTNRTAQLALQEWWKEERDGSNTSCEIPEMTPITTPGQQQRCIMIELPRYSWSTLGRMLLRVCKDGTSYISTNTSSTNRVQPPLLLLSPTIQIQLSPLIALPAMVLSNIVSFLHLKYLWPLEATCRALSASMISVRVMLNNNTTTIDQRTIAPVSAAPEQDTGMKAVPMISTEAQPIPADDTGHDNVVTSETEQQQQQIKRKSSRVQSQMITSGKRTDRSSRRNSTEFCFLASILGISTINDPNYERLVQSYNNYQPTGIDSTSNSTSNSISAVAADGINMDTAQYPGSSATKKQQLQKICFEYYWNDASLYRFIHSVSATRHYLSPVVCMFRFVAHASIHVAQVFTSTGTDTTASLSDMPSLLLDCIDWMNRRTNLSTELISSWSLCKNRVPKDSNLDDIAIFAIDLLHAELRLRRCETNNVRENCDFDSDGNFISIIFPELLDIVTHMDQKSISFESKAAKQWKVMKMRCYWLAASWYFWRGLQASNVRESRQAEEEGISWVEATKQCLYGTESISTPHLPSMIRKGQHWKELSSVTLSSFTDEVQASAVVLQVQERFLRVTRIFSNEERTGSRAVTQSHCDALSHIGDILMERYSCTEGNSKSLEIIENFLNVHGEQLVTLSVWDENTRRSWFEDMVPSAKVVPNGIYKFSISPAILTIYVTCLRTSDENSTTIALALSRLVTSLIDMSDDILACQRIQWDKMLATRVADDLYSDFDSDIDDDFLSVDEYGDTQNRKQKLNSDEAKLQTYSTLVLLLLQRILSFCKEALTSTDQLLFIQSAEFDLIITRSLSFTADLFRFSYPVLGGTSSTNNDFGVFVAVQDLFQWAQSILKNGNLRYFRMTTAYIEGMFHIVVTQRQTLSSLTHLKPNKNGKNERLRATRKRADLVAAACFDLGLLLSANVANIGTDRIVRSEIFTDLQSDLKPSLRLVSVCDALLWFWKAATDVNTSLSVDKDSIADPHLSSYLDEFGRERLRVPVATAIVGLCASTLSVNPVVPAFFAQLVSLSEFYDSDASAAELTDDTEVKDGSDKNKDMVGLHRVVVQAIHCVGNVFALIDEKEACSYSYIKNYVTINGPGLPLVVSRVLNIFVNRVLLGFKVDDVDSRGIWGDYTFGTRSVGFLLDSALWKAYKCLHGFVLTNETKDSIGGTCGNTGGLKPSHCFPPESNEAAAMLYRCIMRTYAQGRRSPPKAALETVLSALPQLDESKKSSWIRKYLFSSKVQSTEVETLLSVALRRTDWEDTFASIEGFAWINAGNDEPFDDEISRVRRGLARLMAHGPIPRLQDNGDEKDWRPTSAQSEEDMSTKFNAVVDDLCFGDTTDWEGWFKASQCLNMKSDVIADRLGLSRGFNRNPNFSIPEMRSKACNSYILSDLDSKQHRELLQHDAGWVQSLGDDLSIFIRNQWSSYKSLKGCYQDLEVHFANDCNLNDSGVVDFSSYYGSWYEIKSMYDRKDFAQWQLALGGLFVSSLRRVAYRCLSLAIYISNQKNATNGNVHSELIEALAVNFYVELMGSQSYGFPMKVMPTTRKRTVAADSLACFEQAVGLMDSDEESGDKVEAWSLLFMMGKCHEKIAKSFENESFSVTSVESSVPSRRYEYHMMMALKCYSDALSKASHIKESGGFISEQNGGSSHGVLETFYRLHASRLKCLISAVDKNDEEREHAELEALRLTECHSFSSPESSEVDHSLRQRIWSVLIDVVGALAKCSSDNSFFHRSVYRHAQALMWAPAIYGSLGDKAKGSLGSVPVTWASKIRGLNSTADAASSGLGIISSLFSKKRGQLVGVWVTMDGETTPFETINNSARKYDSLRGKYIAAYIDSLRLCRRRKELDVFLTWTTACSRDLPSHFAASALLEGGMPGQAPTLECLVTQNQSIMSLHFLKTVRRRCNSALARVLVEDMNDYSLKGANLKPAEAAVKYFETQLKIAYACFLRLNCDFQEIAKKRTWQYEKENGLYDVAEALTLAYTKVCDETTASSQVDLSDWSGESQLRTTMVKALQKCKELYPSLPRNFSFTRQRAAPKPKSPSFISSSKRKLSPNHEKKSFEVSIPEGLKEGETFLTSIMVGDTAKRVRLTVPSESASSLRFSLEVPLRDVKNSSDTVRKSSLTPTEST